MKNPLNERLWISREVRLALIVLILYLVGSAALAAGDWKLGITAFGIGLALVAAYYFAIIRPAQIPHDAVLVVRLAGPIEEDVTRSPLDQLMRRGAISLDHLRYAFESAAIDKDVRAIVVEIAEFRRRPCHRARSPSPDARGAMLAASA